MKVRTKRERDALDAVTLIRERNNTLWMRILEIAVQYAPKETRLALKEINKNDRAISKHLKDI